jgi:hypothetical protein
VSVVGADTYAIGEALALSVLAALAADESVVAAEDPTIHYEERGTCGPPP